MEEERVWNWKGDFAGGFEGEEELEVGDLSMSISLEVVEVGASLSMLDSLDLLEFVEVVEPVLRRRVDVVVFSFAICSSARYPSKKPSMSVLAPKK